MEMKLYMKNIYRMTIHKIIRNPIILFSIILIILALFFKISTKLLLLTQRENFEYSKLDINQQYEGKVLKKYEDKGFAFITLSDSKKVWLPHSRNYEYTNSYLADFIQLGDSIQKKPNNDTLYIYRHCIRYYFLPGKFINHSIKPE